MPALRPRELAIIASGLALVIALAVAAAVLAPPSAGNLPPGSSFSYEGEGSAAALQTLTRLGYSVRRSFDPVAALGLDPASVVLVIAEPAEVPTNSDRRALQAMVSAGATVLVTGCGAVPFLTGSDTVAAPSEGVPRSFAARFESPLSAHAPRITMRTDCGWWEAGSQYTTLYGDAHGAAVRFKRSGTGTIVWWSGSTPLSNASIEEPGNLELLLNVAGDRSRTILWDEFYHGQRRSLYSYAKNTPLPWAAAQLALLLVVAAAMFVRRRTPVFVRAPQSRASPLEFVDTMAGLYARAGTAADAVATARLRLRRLLAEATGLAADADDRHLAAAGAARCRVDAAELTAALQAATGLDDTMTGREALPLVRRLQTCAAGLDRRGG